MKHTLLRVGCLLLMGLSWQVGAYDEDDLKTFLVTNECPNCDLAGANLTGANLYGANLGKNATLKRANLRGANVWDELYGGTGAKLCNTKMSDGTINNSGCSRSYTYTRLGPRSFWSFLRDFVPTE